MIGHFYCVGDIRGDVRRYQYFSFFPFLLPVFRTFIKQKWNLCQIFTVKCYDLIEYSESTYFPAKNEI